MASFERTTTDAVKSIKRLAPDMNVVLGKADVTIAQFQALAQSSTDGKFYKYVKGDAALGTIAGIYTGTEDITLTAAGDDGACNISTLAIVPEDYIVGVDFDTDYTAVTTCKQCGIILTTDIEGSEEA
jgi:hypothetical protein